MPNFMQSANVLEWAGGESLSSHRQQEGRQYQQQLGIQLDSLPALAQRGGWQPEGTGAGKISCLQHEANPSTEMRVGGKCSRSICKGGL